MRHRLRIILCSLTAGALLLTGCGSGGTAAGDIQIKDSSFTGTVKSAEGNEITLELAQGAGGGGGMPGAAPGGDMQQSGQTPPEMPQGDSQQRGPQQGGGSDSSVTIVITVSDESVLKDSDGNSVAISDIKEGDSLTVTTDENGTVTGITAGKSGQGAPGGETSSGAPESYDSANTYSEDTEVEDKELSSTGTDESVTLTENGAAVTLDKVTATRKNDDSTGGDAASFYGVGAAVLTTEGKTVVKNSKITTDASGAAGVFAYGQNSTAYVSDTAISTKQDASGGIHVAGGGTVYAWNNTVTTEGGSSAAIRSDRGGGTMVVEGGTYQAGGTGSPAVYCTADITVNDAELTSTASEGICIEGKNALRLYDCDLTSSQTENEQNDNIWNLIVYQSMSGDAEEGEGTLIVDGGSISAKEGGLFYTTNTQSVITVSDVTINYPEKTDYFLRCTGNANKRGWGSTGSNGADCTFTADDQLMKGDIIYDSISNLDFYMVNGSTLKGAFIDDESCAGDGGDGKCTVVIDSSSVWTVTGDSEVSSLSCEGKITDKDGKTVTIKGTDGTVYVKGDSKYTVTTASYSDKADTSGANKTGSFSDYAVDPA